MPVLRKFFEIRDHSWARFGYGNYGSQHKNLWQNHFPILGLRCFATKPDLSHAIVCLSGIHVCEWKNKQISSNEFLIKSGSLLPFLVTYNHFSYVLFHFKSSSVFFSNFAAQQTVSEGMCGILFVYFDRHNNG